MFQPLKDDIYDIIEEEGLRAFSGKNEIGITPSRYLNENPYADVMELEIIREYMSKKFILQNIMIEIQYAITLCSNAFILHIFSN